MLHPQLDVQNAQVSITWSPGHHRPRARPQTQVRQRPPYDQIATSPDQVYRTQ